MSDCPFKRLSSFSRPQLRCTDASMTDVSFQRDCNMLNILHKFAVTGVLDSPNINRPRLRGDEYPSDFTEGCNRMTVARNDGRTEEEMLSDVLLGEDSGVTKNDSSSVPLTEPKNDEVKNG